MAKIYCKALAKVCFSYLPLKSPEGGLIDLPLFLKAPLGGWGVKSGLLLQPHNIRITCFYNPHNRISLIL
jgi:hypothetical protein